MLKIKILIIFIIILSSISLAQKTDIVIMNNGIFLIGEIKKMQFGLLTLSTDDMGTLSIKWEKIRHISSKFIFDAYGLLFVLSEITLISLIYFSFSRGLDILIFLRF